MRIKALNHFCFFAAFEDIFALVWRRDRLNTA